MPDIIDIILASGRPELIDYVDNVQAIYDLLMFLGQLEFEELVEALSNIEAFLAEFDLIMAKVDAISALEALRTNEDSNEVTAIINSAIDAINNASTIEEVDILLGQAELDVLYQRILESDPIPGFNLNTWEEEGALQQDLPEGQIFTYDTHIYKVKATYNPQHHGLPGTTNLTWAFYSLELDWQPSTNYDDNQVVRDGATGKYYISIAGEWNTFTLDKTWAWQEIEPIADEYFGFFPGTNVRDYTTANQSVIVPK